MSRRTKFLLLASAALILVGGVIAWRWNRIVSNYLAYCVRISTSALPYCDRVEVFSLDGNRGADATKGFPIRPDKEFSAILDRKILSGSEAESLAALWRSQIFGAEYQALCHEPAYAFRFYNGSSLKFETSVCFDCSDFYVATWIGSGWWGFDAKSSNAAKLLKRLQEIFPASIQKPKTK